MKRLFLFLAGLVLVVLATERSVYGATLTSIGLTIIFTMAEGLLAVISIVNPWKRVVILKYLVLVSIYYTLIYTISFGKYIGNGELYLEFTALIKDGRVTTAGYVYVLVYSFTLSLLRYAIYERNMKNE
jgi:hypothetical protein